MSGLIERAEQLQAFESAVGDSFDSGRVVLVSGEAGFGKTSLLRTFLGTLDHRFSVLIGACEPVGIPVAFSPLFDFLEVLPAELSRDVRSGTGRPEVYTGMLDLLKNDRMILVLEDMHWADEATLGLVRYLGRRISATNSILVITFRSEEVDPTHPLRLVIAGLGREAVRIDLPPLTVDGVAEMAHEVDLDPVALHHATLGNPFFVEEIVRHPGDTLPPTIGNAIMASAARLPQGSMELLYMVALSHEGIDLELVAESDPEAGDRLDAAVQRLLLDVSGSRVTCRHDLVRESLLRVMPPVLGRKLHRRLLAFLENSGEASRDIARLAYHSVGAGETEKAAEFSLQAARDASRLGAHRQAAFHYGNALAFREGMEPVMLAETLLEAAWENCLINAFDTAVELSRQRLELAADPLTLARARAWYGFFLHRENDIEACEREALAAIEVLRGQPVGEELALGLFTAAWAYAVRGDGWSSRMFAEEAKAAAQTAGSRWVEVQASVSLGYALLLLGDREGVGQIQEAADMGVELELGETTARALNALGWIGLEQGRLEEALPAFERLNEYCAAHELDAWYVAGMATRAWLNVFTGRWDEADLDFEVVLGQRTCRQTEIETLVAASTLRLRRGDPGALDMIEEALDSFQDFADHVAARMVCALVMEAAWVGVYPRDEALERYRNMLASPTMATDRAGLGTLGFWACRLGVDPPEGRIPGPAGLEWGGSVAESAAGWRERGYPIEAAVAAAMAPDSDLDGVFAELTRLGAHGVIRGLRGELARRGVRHIPRGKRSATRAHPAGLTPRQAEVLTLMISGLSNAAIADELFITEKTASHHVSAVLAKLNVSSRLQAVALATTNGWDDGTSSN